MKTPKKASNMKTKAKTKPAKPTIMQQLLTRQRVCRDQAAEIARLKEELAQAREPKDTTYNGWSNYETWWMALIFDNDCGLQARFADDADNLVSDVDRSDDFKASIISNLATIMEDWLGEFIGDGGGRDLMKDMCNAFIQSVDFEEIARHYIDDAIENNK